MNKDKRLTVRLSSQSYADALMQSRRSGCRLSDYVRQVLTTGQAVDADELINIKKELNKIGVNVNQLARQANTSGYSDDMHNQLLGQIERFKQILLKVRRGF